MTAVRIRRWSIAGGVLAFAAACLAATPQPAANDKIAIGNGALEFRPDAERQQAIKVWTYRPDTFGPDSPIVFVMHGAARNAKTYRDAWVPYSRKGGYLIVAPEFPQGEYPGEVYQQGNILDRAGKPVPPEQWTFSAIEKLFDRVKALTGTRAEKYYLYGHSGGGQFVERFVLFMPEARYARAIAANPGYYTFPTPDAPYPYGLEGTPNAGRIKPAVFGRDFVLMLGVEDTNRDDPDLRKTPQADAQGLTRFARGQKYFATATAVAERAHAAFNWRLVTVPGVGHSNEKMTPAAARELFAKHE